MQESRSGLTEKGLERGIGAGGAGGENDPRGGMVRTDALDQFAAAHFRHRDVGEDEVDRRNALLCDDVQGIETIFGLEQLIAKRTKDTGGECADTHSILHNDVDSDARATKEVEAESTAFVVMHALGFDSAEYSLGYVAHWAKGDAKLIQDVAIRVQKCAKAILEDVFVVRQTAWEKVSKNADADEERAA